MRILYVLGALQHPSMRGSLRHYHLLRHLCRRHRVRLLVLARTRVTAEARADLSAWTEELHLFSLPDAAGARLFRGLPRFLRARIGLRVLMPEMRRRLAEVIRRERPDVLLFHGKVFLPLLEGLETPPLVFDFCDATSLRLRRQIRYARLHELPWRVLRYLEARRAEREILAREPLLSFISARDRRWVLGRAEGGRVVPNGIDLSYWRPRGKQRASRRLVFTGVMDYAPNEDAAFFLMEEVLPRVRAALPETELYVVGRSPTRRLREAAAAREAVTVTGFVEDMRPYLEEATVFVAPIRYASGQQNKILEALAMGVPVVTTPVVANGLVLDPGNRPPVEAAQGAEACAERVLLLLGDEERRSRLAAAGRRYVEAHFDWAASAGQIEAMCREARAAGNGRGAERAPAEAPSGRAARAVASR